MNFGSIPRKVRLDEDRLTEVIAALTVQAVDHRIAREKFQRAEGSLGACAQALDAWTEAAREYARMLRPWDPVCVDDESRRVINTLSDACLSGLGRLA